MRGLNSLFILSCGQRAMVSWLWFLGARALVGFLVFWGAQANTHSSNTLSFWFLGARAFGLLRAQIINSRFDFLGFEFSFLRAQTMVLCFALVLRALFSLEIPRIWGFFSFHSTRPPRS